MKNEGETGGGGEWTTWTTRSLSEVVPELAEGSKGDNWDERPRAKELALSQYNMGADIIFSCASTAGDGTMQAGKEVGKFVIGVDSDQAMLYKETDPDQANLIPSSVLKRVDMSLLQSIKAAQEGTLPWGTRVALGIADDCIGLADNEIYQAIVPADTKALITEYSDKIKSGEVKVVSAFDMENQEVLDYVNEVK